VSALRKRSGLAVAALGRQRALAAVARRRPSAFAVFGAGAAVIAVVLVILLSQTGLRRLGNNDTPVQGVIGTLAPGATGCQPEPMHKGARGVEIYASPTQPGRVAIRIKITGAGRYDGTGGTGGLIAGGLAAPLAHGAPPPRFADTGVLLNLCVINTGQVPLALIGAGTGADQLTLRQAGSPPTTTVGRLRIDDLVSGRAVSLWEILPMLPDRFAAATGSLLAPWLVVGGGILALLAMVGLLRGGGEVDEN
jgi:hypothetical protein